MKISKNLKVYIKRLLLLAVITSLLSLVYVNFAPARHVSDAIYWLTPFFAIISLSGRVLLEYLIYSKSKWFSYAILGIRAGKFLIYVAVILLYAFNNREEAVMFILTFFMFYLVYTFFDIKSTYAFMQKNKTG